MGGFGRPPLVELIPFAGARLPSVFARRAAGSRSEIPPPGHPRHARRLKRPLQSSIHWLMRGAGPRTDQNVPTQSGQAGCSTPALPVPKQAAPVTLHHCAAGAKITGLSGAYSAAGWRSEKVNPPFEPAKAGGGCCARGLRGAGRFAVIFNIISINDLTIRAARAECCKPRVGQAEKNEAQPT
jgi:hypothetical protein